MLNISFNLKTNFKNFSEKPNFKKIKKLKIPQTDQHRAAKEEVSKYIQGIEISEKEKERQTSQAFGPWFLVAPSISE